MFRHYKAQTPVALQIKDGQPEVYDTLFQFVWTHFNVFTKSDSLKAFSVLFAKNQSKQSIAIEDLE